MLKKKKINISKIKKILVEKLSLNELKHKSSLFTDSLNWFEKGRQSLTNLADLEKPFYCLEISDYNANGLSGRWNRGITSEDKFYNLVLSINSTKKQSTDK